ncbi:MAG: ankyrin repeat domain-containing protein [Verrucomicrobiota bacterium]|nr:ankyrin repeat domain-containing protein [Verrucomicrobiota bacterium]MDP7293283.1 ankyrin repeat domain-containing protein [Verrucomicrobiota bacterium]HJN82834.1 ankyrin repeat domain-containing protein [Verrucomicrobiota bacterium]
MTDTRTLEVNAKTPTPRTPPTLTALGQKREEGWTPLHYAADGGDKEIAELLIAAGADVNL